MKEYVCVQVGHHNDVGSTIEESQKSGWRLHTYQVTGRDIWITHYLLFERGECVERAHSILFSLFFL